MNEKLALYGGKPIRESDLYYGSHIIEDDDVDAVVRTLRAPYITCGPKVEEAEKKLASVLQADYVSVVSNGTAALHCACLAAGIGPGDEVITTPLTFAASANCILYCGARPVFADIDSETYNIDPESIESHITNKTKAIIAVDYSGQAVEIEMIRRICDKHNLLFIEDAAHAIGTFYKNMPVGSYADITCFSFHPVKTITSGEGGAVSTNDPNLAYKLALAHAHGIVKDEKYMEEAPHEGVWYYEQIDLGYNYRMTDFQAALLLSQLDKLDRFKARRKEIAKIYSDAFADMPGIILQKNIPESDTCPHLYIIRLDFDRLKCTRREFFDAMSAEKVHPQIHYVPVYWFPHYKRLGYERGLCPIAEDIYRGIMSIPLYPRMTDQDIEDTINAVRKVTNYYLK